jgi:zona occludens toxin
MAITAYTGLPGNGKTYEVVKEVLLPALASGRRIVTNIAGIHFDLMRAYLVENEQGANVGEIVAVTSAQVGDLNFFPTDEKPDGATVHGGDLVVIDECWRWWGKGCAIPKSHSEFFAYHRHFVNDVGCCDLVVITQDIQNVHGELRRQIESYYTFRKQKALGLSSRYYYTLRQGYQLRAEVIREGLRTYDKKFFPFYSSYKGKGVDERDVDARLNVFRGGFFKFVAPLALFFLVGGLYGVYRFFAGSPVVKNPVEAGKAVVATAPAVGPSGTSGSSVGAGSLFRYVGEIVVGGEKYAVVEKDGRLRFVLVRGYVRPFPEAEIFLDGERVNSRTGFDPAKRERGGLGAGGGRG